ncbi:MAG TPA: hypothetical protein VKB96_09340, partial [Gammaproteobacteria bacterium]|nr:hypothetical protein [Gammaproteobacteria bacterium]
MDARSVEGLNAALLIRGSALNRMTHLRRPAAYAYEPPRVFRDACLMHIEATEPMANIISLIVIYGLILHMAMFAFDFVNPDPFLMVDRARERLANIEGLSTTISHSSHIGEYLATHGVIGDYFIHAVIYIPLGQYGV